MSTTDPAHMSVTPPFAVCLRQLAEQRIRLRAEDGRIIFEPAPSPELASALEPYTAAMLAALAASDGEVTWIPLTPNQEALWYLQAANPAAVDYNQAAAFKAHVPLDRAALTHAVAEITRYTLVIRSCFAAVDGALFQQFRVDLPTPLTIEDATGWDDARLEARLSEILHQPYDLARPAMLHVHAFDLGPDAHAIMVRAHHIISDLWSLTLLLERLCEAYAAARSGAWLRLPEPPFPYPDYALAQRELVEGPRGEELRAFWREQLHDCQPGLDLPTDFARPAQRTGRGDMYHFELSPELTTATLGAARALHTTPYTLMLSALQVMFFRLTGQRDLMTGTPMHGRRDRRTRGTLGYLSNMTVLRNQLDPQETFTSVVERMHRIVSTAMRRHDYPFPLVADLVPGQRDPGRPVLIETSFTLLQSGDAGVAAFPVDRCGVRFSLSGLPLETLSIHPRFAPFDLSLLAAQLEATIACAWQYNTDLFTEATMAQYTARFQTLLASVAADPQRRLGELDLLPVEERAQLNAWNATDEPFDLRLRVTDLVTASATAHPEATAVDDPEQPLTYGKLERLTHQISRALLARGVGRGAFVGVHLRRSPLTVPVLLGILRTGAAYLPLDPDYPAARLAFMLEDSEARLVISDTSERLADAPADCRFLALHALLRDAEQCSPEPAPLPNAEPEDPAYILYTSGSTGQPKGVVIPHRALSNFLQAMQRTLRLSPDDRALALTSISFDIAALELYLPLVAGACLRIVTRDDAVDAFRLAALLRSWRPTLVQATPATWTMLLEAGWEGAPDMTALCGGEALGRDLANALLTHAGAVWNMYGPTETTIWSTMWRVAAGGGPVSIGHPIANTTCYALDECGAEAATGAAGELVIGGAGVALGYHRRPSLTDERFVWHAGERVYRTGDRVRRRRDGALDFLGRLDSQIKLHGHRIELGEIESALRALPGVAQAAARLFGPEQPHRLVGYVAPGAGVTFDVGQLRDALRDTLPSYMVPSALVALEALPLTPNQKVDRAALPAPEPTPVSAGATLSENEARIAAIWSEMLCTSIDDPAANFFDCGGHSLLLMTMLARVQREYARDVSVAAFLRQPTVAHLARLATGEPVAAPGAYDPLERDVALDWPERLQATTAPRAQPRAILLTGATGFLGAHLLDALLRQTSVRIYCLVRGSNGSATIARQLRRFGLDEGPRLAAHRIIPVQGDLAEVDCGLNHEDWRFLAEAVDTIIHCGALVNFVYPYESLRGANVLGAHALLRLALEGRAKSFQLISTFSVFDSPEYATRPTPILECEFPASALSIVHPYGQSKWAAEALARRAARERGLRVSVYRPGRVSGHSRTGVSNPTDLLDLVLAGCIEIGAVPDIPMTLDMTPVDYVADAIARLACQPHPDAATYHLVNRRPTTSMELVAHLRQRGYTLAELPYDAWRERIRQTENAHLLPLLPLFTDDLPIVLGGGPVFDTSETERGLTCSGIVCPPADDMLLARYTSYLVESERWPAPAPVTTRSATSRA